MHRSRHWLRGRTGRAAIAALAALGVIAAGCSGDGDEAAPPDTLGQVAPGGEVDYRARLDRTGNGVAHVEAEDLGGLGFGTGWAAAEDHACTLAEAVVSASGSRARWFGPGPDGSNVDSDVTMVELGVPVRAEDAVDELTAEAAELLDGYLAGVRSWYGSIEIGEIEEACPVAVVLADLDLVDLLAVQYRLALASDLELLTSMATAAPPTTHDAVGAGEPEAGGLDTAGSPEGGAGGVGPATDGPTTDDAATDDGGGDPAVRGVQVGPAVPTAPGGTAWAIGGETTESGMGALGAQPLLDWDGVTRLWEHHLRLAPTVDPDVATDLDEEAVARPEDEPPDGAERALDAAAGDAVDPSGSPLDVYGASFVGVPVPVVGFNTSLAFSPAPSPSPRGAAYRLALLEGDPSSHVVDGTAEMFVHSDHVVDVLVDGELVAWERTTWRSRFGPIVEPVGFEWSTSSALSWHGVALDTPPMINGLLALATSGGLSEAQEAVDAGGAPAWAATVVATADGVTWYGDTAATPRLSDATRAAFDASLADPAVARAAERGLVVLDGTVALTPGDDDLAPLEESPSTERRDFVAGVGSGSWLANPEEPRLDGHPTRRAEPRALDLSDRQSLLVLRSTLESSQETGGRLDLVTIQEALLGETDLTADLLFDSVLARCRRARSVEVPAGRLASGAARPAQEVDLGPVCSALSRWARNHTLESRSALLWRLFVDRFEASDLRGAGVLFDVPFREADPLGTPRSLASRTTEVPDPVVVALAEASLELDAVGAPLDAWLREVQWVERGGERIPLHGGSPGRGSLSGVTIVPGDGGMVVTGGPSFLMTVAFTDDGPVADALLAYGQSDRRDAITHADQTYRYSDRAWRPVAFTVEDILADPALTTHELVGEAPAP